MSLFEFSIPKDNASIFMKHFRKFHRRRMPARAKGGARIIIRAIQEQTKRSFKRPSGRLSKSFKENIKKNRMRADMIVVEVKGLKTYAGVQNWGGTITSSGKAMTVPENPNLRHFDKPWPAGSFIRKRSVRIPGTRYLDKAVANPSTKRWLQTHFIKSVHQDILDAKAKAK